MQLGLHGKVAVVTGASRGIGKAVAQALLEEGCAVAICSRNPLQLDVAVAELSKKGRVFGAPTDVTDENGVKRFIDAVLKEFIVSIFSSTTPALICAAPSRRQRLIFSNVNCATRCLDFSR